MRLPFDAQEAVLVGGSGFPNNFDKAVSNTRRAKRIL